MRKKLIEEKVLYIFYKNLLTHLLLLGKQAVLSRCISKLWYGKTELFFR